MIERTAAMEMASRLGTMAAELMEDVLGEGALRPVATPEACLARASMLEALGRDIAVLESAIAVLGRRPRD